ncbi:MAG: YetF domain-containing protein [Gemmataceae bacterium]
MCGFADVHWAEVFVPDLSLAESFVRGSVVYLSLLALFRIVLRRQGGAIGMPDVMLVVLVSECVSPALTAEAKSVPNGLATVAALLFWNYALDWLAFRSRWLRRVLEPDPLPIVRDGRPIREHLNQERMSDDELAAQLRGAGIDDMGKVKVAYLEAGGAVSVIPKDDAPDPPPPPQASPPIGPAEFELAVRRFAEAAAVVRAAVAWHEERSADHRAAAKAARKLLAVHGVRSVRSAATSSTDESAHMNPAG